MLGVNSARGRVVGVVAVAGLRELFASSEYNLHTRCTALQEVSWPRADYRAAFKANMWRLFTALRSQYVARLLAQFVQPIATNRRLVYAWVEQNVFKDIARL